MKQRRRTNKEQRERRLVRRFLRQVGIPYRLQGVRSVGRGVSGPDVKVTCIVDGGPKRVGIEVTEYQSDATVRGGSPGRARGSFEASLGGILDRQPPGGHVTLRLDKTSGWALRDVGALVEEIERFSHEAPQRLGARCFSRNACVLHNRRYVNPFQGYSKMEEYLEWISLDDDAGPASWRYGDAQMGIGRETFKRQVLRTIAQKATKCRSYERTGLKELWLLVCAGASHCLSDSAGPDMLSHQPNRFSGAERDELAAPDNSNASPLEEDEVLQAASKSGFDRVLFCELAWGWCKQLHPPSPLKRAAETGKRR